MISVTNNQGKDHALLQSYDSLKILSTSDCPEEETALEWLKRVRSNKRKISQNPIHFPIFTKPHREDCDGDADSLQSFDPTRFIVTSQNFIHMAAQTFQCRTEQLDELKGRTMRWRLRRPRPSFNATSNEWNEKMTQLEDELLQSFPIGSGIPFLDRLLTMDAKSKNKDSMDVNAFVHVNSALEIVGRTGTAKTKILMTVAANYAASTSAFCMGSIMKSKLTTVAATDEDADADADKCPIIVIFDPEYAIDADELMGLVRVSVLRRWNATSDFRQCLGDVNEIHQNFDGGEEGVQLCMNNGNDYADIEQDIQSAFARIHIVRPRDVSKGYVPLLECLSQELDKRAAAALEDQGSGSKCSGSVTIFPPTMLLMDSVLSAFQITNKMQDAMPNGSGTSGLNDFIRQLKRLRSKHAIIMLSTRTISGEMRYPFRSKFDKWDTITTQYVSVMKTVPGSPEKRDGNDFVAICKPRNDSMGGLNVGQNEIYPFSFSSKRIVCDASRYGIMLK